MDIAVIGSGSMASLFAAKLAAKNKVCLIGSWKEQLSAIRDSGLELTELSGSQEIVHIEVSHYSAAAGSYPLALILVKGWQTEAAAGTAKRLLAPGGLALTLQNGIGHLEIIASIIGSKQAAVGVTSEGAMVAKPGHVMHTGIGETHLGLMEGAEYQLERISATFRRAGFKTDLQSPIDSLIWGKLAVNAGINPLTALMQVPNGFLLMDEAARETMNRAAEETAAVANSLGISLPYPDASQRVSEVARATSGNRSSMAQDIARGAPTEIDFITGQIVEIGRRIGVDVSVNEALLHLVRSLINSGDWIHEIENLDPELRERFRHLGQLDKEI